MRLHNQKRTTQASGIFTDEIQQNRCILLAIKEQVGYHREVNPAILMRFLDADKAARANYTRMLYTTNV